MTPSPCTMNPVHRDVWRGETYNINSDVGFCFLKVTSSGLGFRDAGFKWASLVSGFGVRVAGCLESLRTGNCFSAPNALGHASCQYCFPVDYLYVSIALTNLLQQDLGHSIRSETCILCLFLSKSCWTLGMIQEGAPSSEAAHGLTDLRRNGIEIGEVVSLQVYFLFPIPT